ARDPWPTMLAAVVAAVLDADQGRLRPPEVPPLLGLLDRAAVADHAPEEVVRGQEGEVPPKVAIALHDVVLVRRHVLVVAWEDDELIGPGEVFASGDRVEITVAEDVDLQPA